MCNIKWLIQVTCLSFVVIQTVDGSNFFLYNTTRVRRQSNNISNRGNCKKPQNFPCKNGQCIDADKECDGNVDCTDASDESNSCHRIKCPAFLFTCKYGACIGKDLKCDGKPDCRDGSDEKNADCGTQEQASPLCKNDEFRCSSGQCIDEDLKCDGKADCDDRSDEIKASCWNIKCPGYTHKCDYGACVNGNAECNGIVECYDGSDEKPSKCGTSPTPPTPPVSVPTPVFPVPSSGTCILPEYPAYGSWSLYGANGNYAPGAIVSPGTILTVKCNKSHKLDGESTLFCNKGRWSSNIGTCLKLCQSRVSTATMKVTCIFKNEETENCTDATEGTLARFECAPYYEDFNLKRKPVHICHDGNWDQPKPECVPVCGQKSVEPTKLIINGTKVNKGDYPWQVALYTKHDKLLICGGSLISQKVILTAAHCITDGNGIMASKENYVVAVGKYYRQFNDSRDYSEAQFSDLHVMYIPEQYRGEKQNYLGDIAILVTRKVFALSKRVQPVCFDVGQNYDLHYNEYGYVTGWGFTAEDSNPSDVLKEIKIPSITISTCKENLPEDYEIYLTHDKLCAGYLDKASAVCSGDSGGGLVFKHDGRYYVTGIVSLSPQSPSPTGGCNSNQYGLYTKVSNYMIPFILPKVTQFKT